LFLDVAAYFVCCPRPCADFFGFVSTVGRPLLNRVAINYPAKTFGDPAATDVQPDIPSPTLPHPLPFTNTVVLPVAIAAACGGHTGAGGGKR
tara:strand:+ start:172 stop:447 length:276 start_codon:yes stop_codon:yes gene_type:complete